MKLKKIGKNHYLLVKLNARDRRYMAGFIKFERKKTVRNTNKYMSDMIAIHIKAVYVMQCAMLLESEGVLNKKKANRFFL